MYSFTQNQQTSYNNNKALQPGNETETDTDIQIQNNNSESVCVKWAGEFKQNKNRSMSKV